MNTVNDGVDSRTGPRHGTGGFLTGALLGVAGLAALGTWQLDRLAQKEAMNAERRAMLVRPAVDLASLKDPARASTHRRVAVSGRFRHDREILIGPRPRRGIAGWQVITPLERDDGGVVLVDRGWVPDTKKDPQGRLDGQVTGPVTLTGFVKTVSARNPFVPDNDAAKGNWYWIDPVSMAAHLKLADVAPYWLVANRGTNPAGGPVVADGMAMPANSHLYYAIIWYALAASLCVVAFFYWRRASQSE